MSEQCEHHFILEPPNGTVSMGRCKKCNQTKEHYNFNSKGFNRKTVKGHFANGFKG